MSAAGVIDHEAQYGDDDYLCYADHRSDYINAVTILKGCASRFGPNAELVYGHNIFYYSVIKYKRRLPPNIRM